MASLSKKLIQAIHRRDRLRQKFEALRWCDGAGDGLPGLTIDGFGAVAVVHVHRERFGDRIFDLQEIATVMTAEANCSTVYGRVREKDPNRTAATEATLISGPPVEEIWIDEHGVSYLVMPAEQVNSGFFIDMREVRHWLLSNCAKARVLNLFCFTGSLGAAAYAGGASEVTQVDVSKRALAWAKRNLERAHGSGKVRVLPEDCRVFLRREVKRVSQGADRYDTIIIDPPAFGRAKGKSFRLQDELSTLVSQALILLKPGGNLIMTANVRALSSSELHKLIKQQLHQNKLDAAELHRIVPPGVDFTASERDSTASRGYRLRLP